MAVTLCPVALAVGCRRCPVFSICPLKGVIGDQSPEAQQQPAPQAKKSGGKKKAS